MASRPGPVGRTASGEEALSSAGKWSKLLRYGLDLEGQLADRAYPILASLVVPRPIALVTTVSPEGKINAAPFSFFNVLGADPPILAVAPGDRDDGTPT